MDVLDILTSFGANFLGGVQKGMFDLKCSFGVSGFRGSVAGRLGGSQAAASLLAH